MSSFRQNGQTPTFGQLGRGGSQAGYAGHAGAVAHSTRHGLVPRSAEANEGTSHRAGRTVKGLRFVSALVDSLIIAGLLFAAISIGVVTGILQPTPAGTPSDPTIGLKILLLLAFPCFLYGTLMEASRYQGTVGKIITGTIVVDYDRNRISMARAIGRNLGKILSGIVPFYIPYLMVFFTEENQSLHDKMAGTVVCKKLSAAGPSYEEIFG